MRTQTVFPNWLLFAAWTAPLPTKALEDEPRVAV